ncbi:DUF2339 domain-containing protein [Granulicella tundricola]|uniref:DUF2339 domain-containing protein n=1 Tax=Granulicella tundricola (strain ATCC BAA-1859 / DSM 23138 / MP5ACTX9) TaxID=1198114 RepID=E8WZR2_GRATM|nr:DUF2339 domain-containing protein [Granulicella tundricola]ADW70036.1 Protein of unknown function DUF2339, transmembrane [Granulicella tundricola MP5ACTX9]
MHPDPANPSEPTPDTLASLAARIAALERQLAALQSPQPIPTAFAAQTAPIQPSPEPPPIPIPPPRPKQSFEDRLGSQIFNRIGVIALLIGTSLILKLAIEHGLIGPVARILIGLAAGVALVLWSERFRRNHFAAFSYSLKAVGTGVLYLTLWAAFHLYHLLPAPIALAAMILVTAWNAWMAFTQDAELLAAYALIGAFATPALLSTGGDHELFLFSYLLAIALAVAALLRLKPWPRLILGSFPATVLYFIAWYSDHFYQPNNASPIALTSAFLIAFFAAYTIPTLTLKSTEEQPQAYKLIPLALILANTAFLALGLYSVLQDTGHHDLLPWLMLALASISLGPRRLQQSPAAAGIRLSLAVTFLTIAIPLKASGRWITIGWLVEGVALLWTAARLSPRAEPEPPSPLAPHRIIRLLACAALTLGFFGAVSLPFWLDLEPTIHQAILNSRFATSLAAIAAFALAAWIARTASTRSSSTPDRLWPTITIATILALNLVSLQAGIDEIATFWNSTGHTHDSAFQTALSISAFLMAYGAALLAAGFWRRTAFIRWQGLILLVIAISKTFLYDVRDLSEGYRVASFMGLGALLMAVSFAYQKDWLNLRQPDPPPLE